MRAAQIGFAAVLVAGVLAAVAEAQSQGPDYQLVARTLDLKSRLVAHRVNTRAPLSAETADVEGVLVARQLNLHSRLRADKVFHERLKSQRINLHDRITSQFPTPVDR